MNSQIIATTFTQLYQQNENKGFASLIKMFMKITGFDIQLEEIDVQQMPDEYSFELYESLILSKIMVTVNGRTKKEEMLFLINFFFFKQRPDTDMNLIGKKTQLEKLRDFLKLFCIDMFVNATQYGRITSADRISSFLAGMHRSRFDSFMVISFYLNVYFIDGFCHVLKGLKDIQTVQGRRGRNDALLEEFGLIHRSLDSIFKLFPNDLS